MSDLISRQAAIDSYGDWYVEEGTEEGFIGTVKQLLEGFPSAQPDSKETSSTHKALDTVSRQAAIDALDTGLWGVEWDKALATAILKDLPSAQPEIIRCKDCRKNPKWEWVGCPMTGKDTRKPDDFCSYAERLEE